MKTLRSFAEATGSTIVTLSQIVRGFDMAERRFPELADIRLPNPIDIAAFTKACFMHQGEARIERLA